MFRNACKRRLESESAAAPASFLFIPIKLSYVRRELVHAVRHIDCENEQGVCLGDSRACLSVWAMGQRQPWEIGLYGPQNYYYYLQIIIEVRRLLCYGLNIFHLSIACDDVG